MLATTNNGSENIGVHAVVVAELKFRDVQRKVLVAHLVERADYAALKDAPKTFNRVGVNRTNDVLAAMMVNGTVGIFFVQTAVAVPAIGCEQADLIGNGFAHEFGRGLHRDLFQNARHDVTLALHGANDRCFARTGTARFAAMFLIPMAVAVFAADPCLVNLDNAAKLLLRLKHCSADFVTHAVRRFIRAEAHLPLNLERGNSLFTRGHQVHDFEPLAERLVRVLKNRARDMREAVALILGAFVALPFEGHRTDRVDLHRAASGAHNAVRPAARDQIRLASFLVGKRGLKLAFRHLVDRLWPLSLGSHFGVSRSKSPRNESHYITVSVPVKPRIIALEITSLTSEIRQSIVAEMGTNVNVEATRVLLHVTSQFASRTDVRRT